MPNCLAASSARLPALALSALFAGLFALLAPAAARAQVVFTGAQYTKAMFPSSLSISPVAVDALGDAFFVVSGALGNTLFEAPANGAPIALNYAFPFAPAAIAVNPQGFDAGLHRQSRRERLQRGRTFGSRPGHGSWTRQAGQHALFVQERQYPARVRQPDGDRYRSLRNPVGCRQRPQPVQRFRRNLRSFRALGCIERPLPVVQPL